MHMYTTDFEALRSFTINLNQTSIYVIQTFLNQLEGFSTIIIYSSFKCHEEHLRAFNLKAKQNHRTQIF